MNKSGCVFLESGINFDLNTVCDCCISHTDGRGMPVLLTNYKGELIDWEELFKIKAQRVDQQKQTTIFDCQGCYHLGDYEFTSEKKISEFHFSHCRTCNAKCIYCSDEYSGGTINYDTYPVIKDLIDKGYYKSGGEATFQGGEPTLMQNFDELINLLIENGTKVRVHTSGIKYSATVEKALSQDKGCVVISLDSATTSVYNKIKQVDAFFHVVNTIKKYALANNNNVIIKYIIIPGINDNLNEINKFFKLMKKLNVKNIALDIEVQYARKYRNKDVSPHIWLIADYFEMMTNKYDMNLLIYSFLSYVINNRKIAKNDKINNKFLFGWYFNKQKDEKKNIRYRR